MRLSLIGRIGRWVCGLVVLALTVSCQSGLPEKGSIDVGPGGPLVVGVAAALSGPLAAEGQGIVNAVTLAVEQQGAVLGRQVTLDIKDDACDSARTEAAIDDLLRHDTLVGVIGPGCSAGCIAAEGPLDRRTVVMISPRCTDIAVTRQGYEGAFRTAWTDAFDAVAAAKFTKKRLGINRVFFVHDGTIYARGIRDVFKLFYGKDNLAGMEEALPGTEDYGPAVRAIRKSTAGMIYYAGFAEDAVRFIAQLRAAGITLPVIMPDAARDAEALYAVAPEPGTVYVTEVVREYSASYQTFASAYRTRFGVDPGHYAAEAYDATVSLLRAVEKTGDRDGDRLALDRRELRTNVLKTDFKGVLGRVRYRINGDFFEDGTVKILRASGGSYAPEVTLDLDD
jgi:branched-chain amino acid transport system substrate-binding protein